MPVNNSKTRLIKFGIRLLSELVALLLSVTLLDVGWLIRNARHVSLLSLGYLLMGCGIACVLLFFERRFNQDGSGD